jgi:ATP-binding cassette subfamily C protein
MAQSISTPDFISFNAAFGQFLGMMMGLVSALVAAAIAVPLYERAKPILQTATEDAGNKLVPGELSGAITLRGVRFRYAADGPAILSGLDLDIRPHEYVAIVGPSGAGKSTLLRLLLGFERPEVGEIAFDRTSLDDFDLHLLRRQIGVVMQQGRLTPGSIFDNIANHGRNTMDDAWEAAEQAGLAQNIRQMPMGMQTYVSEGASTLSGGERQRLMIARAFIRKPRILLFDEATSALDNETQAVVTGTLAQLTCTRIVIAHRLSTIQKVDRIVVISGGKVSEAGSFETLMAQRGEFYALAKRQLV